MDEKKNNGQKRSGFKPHNKSSHTATGLGQQTPQVGLFPAPGIPLNLMNPYQYIQCSYCGMFGHIAPQCIILRMATALSLNTAGVHHQTQPVASSSRSVGGITKTATASSTNQRYQYPVKSTSKRKTNIDRTNLESAFVPNAQADEKLKEIKMMKEKRRQKMKKEKRRQKMMKEERQQKRKEMERAASIPVECFPFDIKSVSSKDREEYSAYLQQLVNNIRLKKEHHEQHEKFRFSLESFLRTKLNNSSVTVAFFGSARNGFGCENCDLDMCVDGLIGETPGAKILMLADVLKSCPLVRPESIVYITSATVPIVKFAANIDVGKENETDYQCDLSVSNDLALRNTALLETYTQIDDRVASLGMLVKYWAKTCEICDASQGSLSSYAYIILVLHYLQREMIIPVLQELVQGIPHSSQESFCFFDDLHKLKDVWPEGFGKNKNEKSLLELFLGFLKYYGQEFDFQSNVITCRTSQTVTRKEKQWMKKSQTSLAIEEPFITSRDLGSKHHASIFRLIRSCFRATYNHLVSRLSSFDPRFTTQSLEVRILFDFEKIFPFRDKAVSKLSGSNGGHKEREGRKARNRIQSPSPEVEMSK